MALVPFYVLLGESNAGWTPFSLLSQPDQTKFSGTISQTEIWNPGRGAYGAVIENLQPGVNTMCENYADPTQIGLEVSFFQLLQQAVSFVVLIVKYSVIVLTNIWRATGNKYIMF